MSAETLLSVGIDLGTTTTQLVFSRLTVRNEGSAFSVPNYTVAAREVLRRQPVAGGVGHERPQHGRDVGHAAVRLQLDEPPADVQAGRVRQRAVRETGDVCRTAADVQVHDGAGMCL